MNLALFDFDGTITRADTWSGFLRAAATPARQAAAAALLAPVLAGYKLGVVPGRAGRPLAARLLFAGRQTADVRALGRRYAADSLPSVVRQRARNRIAWHQDQGDTVVVVSAGLDVYLEPWCEAMAVELVCTRLEEKNGRLTGRYVQGDCCGAEKAVRIRRHYDLARYPTIYAYGDTAEDREMLDLAQVRFYRWAPIEETYGLSSRHPRSR